jgi:fumarate reductase flavoprotein subunit
MKKRFYMLLCAILVILTGCESSGPSGPEDLSTDVVVVGSGLAGLSAALKAREAGVNVILLEKLDITGGSSARSGGGIGAVNSSVQQEFGIQDTAASWKALWQERQATSPVPHTPYPTWEAVDWLLAQGAGLIDWMKEKLAFSGASYGEPGGYGFDPVKRIHFPPTAPENRSMGGALIWFLQQYAEDKGVQILLQHKAVELVRADGEITGVKVETPEGKITVNAKAVVLAAGGFAQSPALLKEWVSGWPEDFGSMAAPGSTGDGILMAEEAGAVRYEDPWVIGFHAALPAKSPLRGKISISEVENVYVNSQGARVTSEAQHYAIITNVVIAAGGTLYSIFDNSDPRAAIVEENLDNVNAFKGQTLEALAAAAMFDSATFKATIENYSNNAVQGQDPQFGKTLDYLALRYENPGDYFKPIGQAPFYAVKVVPQIMGTIGGVKTKYQTGEVLNAQGGTIPGLYAAGENANHIFLNKVYMSGGALAIAATTGRAAGENAAAYAKTK